MPKKSVAITYERKVVLVLISREYQDVVAEARVVDGHDDHQQLEVRLVQVQDEAHVVGVGVDPALVDLFSQDL